MRHTLLTLAALIALSSPTLADTIKATVNGMVCAFCATGIEKTFKTRPEVNTVKVDLEKKLVTIDTKPGQTMNDAEITKVINSAGYSVTRIIREKP
jgi:mercuric ion binding protein